MPVTIDFDWDLIKRKLRSEYRLSPEEVILLLLSFGRVIGRTQLQKEVFIASREVLLDFAGDLLYHPDKFGPYSGLVAVAAKKLQNMGMVSVSPKGEGHSTYFITESGLRYLGEVLGRANIPKHLLDELKRRKANWDEWDTTGITTYVYRKYPEYATKTKIPRLKWEST